MNGTLVREYEAEVTRSHTVFSIREGRSLELVKGQRVTVALDSYGNTYVDGIYVRSVKEVTA